MIGIGHSLLHKADDRIAIGITILKIVGNTSRWQRWSVLFIMGMTIATVIVDIQLWDFARLVAATANGKCIDEDKRDAFNLFSSAWQVFADFFFSVLPMAIVLQLNLPIRKKLYLIFALGLTMVTGGTGIVKTVLTSVIDGTDPTWTVFYVFIWFGTEAMLIIVFGSVPALHPLWEHWVLRRGTLRSRKGTSGSTSYGSRFKGSSSYFGGGGSSKGSRANNGHFKLDGPGKQQNVRDPFQTDDESTKNFNFTVNASSDIELGQLSGPSKQQPSTVAFAVPETNHSSGRRYDSWFQSTNTGSDEEVGLGKIHVKKEVIVSGPNGAIPWLNQYVIVGRVAPGKELSVWTHVKETVMQYFNVNALRLSSSFIYLELVQ
ncbi:hypothetical protein V8F06_013336 [Rhypophila decipiens]